MAQQRITWLADVLRAAKVPVIEHTGWKTRSRPESTGGFAPHHVFWHWDASGLGPSPYELDVIVNGHSTLPGPLYQAWVCRGCRGAHGQSWHVIAAGRCNHAGEGRAIGGVAANQGNRDAIGVSLDWTVNEAQDPIQMAILRRGTAAILRRMGQPGSHLLDHHEYAPNRKIDVSVGSTGLDMDAERSRISSLIALLDAPTSPPAPAPEPTLLERLMALNDAEVKQLLDALFNYPIAGAPFGQWVKRIGENETRNGGRLLNIGRLVAYSALGDTVMVRGVLADLEQSKFPGEGTIIGWPVDDPKPPTT